MILYSLSYIKRIASAFFLFRASDEEEKEVNNKIIKKNRNFFIYYFHFSLCGFLPRMLCLYYLIIYYLKPKIEEEKKTKRIKMT